VRSSLEPLSTEELRRMMADADVVAAGTITSASLSKTWQGPLETVMVEAILKPDRVIKGNVAAEGIEIEESYQQLSIGNARADSKGSRSGARDPLPPIGRYRDGSRVLVFLISGEDSKQYRPLGSGSHDAYLGLFQISPEGVRSDRHRFDETVAGHTSSEAAFVDFVMSIS